MAILSYKEMLTKRLESFEAEYKKGGRPRDPLIEAFNICASHNIPLPDWVADGVRYLFNNPFLDSRLPVLEKVYKAGNYGALQDAVYWCRSFKHPLPEWANVALFDSVKALCIGDKAVLKKWKKWSKEYETSINNWEIYSDVLDAREHGAQWKDGDIYHIAGVLHSNKTEEEGGAKSNTIRSAYKTVAREIKENPLKYFRLETFKKRNTCESIRSDMWTFIKDTIKAGKPKGIKKQ